MTERLAPRHGLMHRLFEGGIAAKGLMGLVEAGAGATLLLTPPRRMHDWIADAARLELIGHPDSALLRHLTRAAETVPADSQHFYAVYLLFHGVMKLLMVGLLWARVAWAYPAAIAIQCGFITFEMHRWLHTGSPVLLCLAALDLAIIGLIWMEWRAVPAP